MRKSFSQAYKDLPNISNNKTILSTQSSSHQETFLQILAQIELCNRKETEGNVLSLVNSLKGTFSSTVLSFKYCTVCMEKDMNKNFTHFVVLRMLQKWVETMNGLRKKKDIRLYEAVIENMQLGVCTYEQFIIYLNYISTDLAKLIKSGNDEILKKHSDLSSFPHLNNQDLIQFLSVALPKVVTNIIVPRNYFPHTLLKSNDQSIDILYCNENLESITQNRTHYNLLLKLIFKILLSMQLEASQIKELILSSFKYYYLYHHDKNCSASQFVIESLKKMTSVVRFAMSEQICLFIIILKKLGKDLFVNYLMQKFSWIVELVKQNQVIGIARTTIKPYYNHTFANSLKIHINAGKLEHHFLEIFDRFSMLYFCVKSIGYDITIRLYHLGKFNEAEGTAQKKLLFSYDKKQGVFEGSIQAIDTGIYMFEFDNSYSWMKGKTIGVDFTILVPLQIKQSIKNPLKSIVFEKTDIMNEVPFENILGWIQQSEIQMNSASVNITFTVLENIKVYNMKLIKNTGQAYEYETESKSRFINKLKNVQKDPHLFWLIEGYKVKGVEQIQKWIDGQFQPERIAPVHVSMNTLPQQMNDTQSKLQPKESAQNQTSSMTDKQIQKQLKSEQQQNDDKIQTEQNRFKDQTKQTGLSELNSKSQEKIEEIRQDETEKSQLTEQIERKEETQIVEQNEGQEKVDQKQQKVQEKDEKDEKDKKEQKQCVEIKGEVTDEPKQGEYE